jgi:hypothetical protein
MNEGGSTADVTTMAVVLCMWARNISSALWRIETGTADYCGNEKSLPLKDVGNTGNLC